jgi:hypothetical protein
VGNLAWIRAYHIGVFADTAPRELFEASGLDLTLIDVDEQQFFDIQPLRGAQVARAKLAPVGVSGPMRLPDEHGAPQVRAFSATVNTHLLAHRSGFLLVRPTIRFDQLDVEGGLTPTALHTLERGIWAVASDLTWQVPGLELTGYVRNYMNYVFLDLFSRWSGDRATPARLGAWAVEGVHGCERLHELTTAGRLEHPFPVSFGTEIQVAVPLAPDESIVDWSTRAVDLAWQIMRPDNAVDTPPRDLETDALTVSWFMDENVSLLIRTAGQPDPDLDVIDPDRAQVLDFLALRRGALTSVQRITQLVITERAAVSREQIARWQYLVATLTDDYILHVRAARLLEPLKLGFAHERRLRDLTDLERQARANLDWFQSRIEAAGQWTGGLIGAAVGAAALAFSLAEPVRLLIAAVTGTPVDEVGDRYGLVLAGSILSVVLLSFAGSFVLVRRLSNTLRPLARRRGIRLARRRRPVRMSAPRQREPREPARIG